MQEALPSLRASGHGVVINVISAGVFMHSGGLSLYASAKSGLLALTRSMAAELAPDGIRVNALAPGTVDTDMVRATDPAAQERMATVSLLGRMATPEEMIGPRPVPGQRRVELRHRPGARGRRRPDLPVGRRSYRCLRWR